MPQDNHLTLHAAHQQDSKSRALTKVLALGLGFAAAGVAAQSAQAQNVTDTFLSPAGTDWSTALWSTGAPPVSNNDVLFNASSGATSTITAENFQIGSFNSTIAEAVTNAGATASILTLGGGIATTDQVPGSNPADLIYVTANSTLNGGTTGALNLVLGQSGQFDAVGGILGIGATTAGVASGAAGTVNLQGFTLTATGTSLITIFSVISGTGSILKTGANELDLNGINTYTGTTTIQNGLLRLLNGSGATGAGMATSAIALGDATSITSNLSPTFQVNGPNTVTRDITVGASSAPTTGTYTLGTSSATSSPTLNGTVTLNQNLTVGATALSSGIFTLAGAVISGSAGTQTITFNNTNILVASTVIGGGTGTIALTKTGAGATRLTGANTYTGMTTINAGVLQLGNAGTTGSLSPISAIVDNATLTINRTNAVTQGTDFSGAPITGTGAFVQAGTGTTTLNAANTYTGTTSFAAGVLNVGNASALGNGGTLNFGGGTLQYGAGITTDFSSRFNQATAGQRTYKIDTNGQNVTFATIIAGGAGPSVTKIGAGTLTMSGANTYTNFTMVLGGTLQAGSTSGFGVNSAVTVANAAGATLDLNNNNVSIGSLTGGGTTGGAVTLGSGTLTTGGDNTSPAAFAGVISGAGGLIKVGTGTQTLGGTNTYTGTTTVNAGILMVASGGTLGSGAVTVNGGGTLSTSATGGTFGLGTSVTVAGTGVLTLGNSTSSSSSQGLSFASTATITLNNATADTLGSLFDTDNGAPVIAPGTYTATQLDSFFGVASFTGAGLLTVTTAVPEPATWVGLVLAVGACGLVLRRQAAGARLA